MKKIIPFIIAIIALLSSPFNANSQTVELNFDINDAQLINAKLSGFNTGPTFNEMFEASASPISIVDACAINRCD
jgi:hypothetical protein